MKEFQGIEKLINFWFRDLSENYRKHLFEWSKTKYYLKKQYYISKGYSKELSGRGAYKQVIDEIYSLANIR